jgi:predicted DNA-binding transcriptional regulator AlpA
MDTFPFPINSDGKSLNWHLAEVLKWYQSTGKSIDTALYRFTFWLRQMAKS